MLGIQGSGRIKDASLGERSEGRGSGVYGMRNIEMGEGRRAGKWGDGEPEGLREPTNDKVEDTYVNVLGRMESVHWYRVQYLGYGVQRLVFRVNLTRREFNVAFMRQFLIYMEDHRATSVYSSGFWLVGIRCGI